MPHTRRENRLVNLLMVFLVANVGFDAWDEWRDEGARDEVQSVLATIEAQTSPEALEAEQEQVRGLILLIDCNTREAFQEALDALADDVLEPGAVVVTENCPREDP